MVKRTWAIVLACSFILAKVFEGAASAYGALIVQFLTKFA